jgi:hypothetical protein
MKCGINTKELKPRSRKVPGFDDDFISDGLPTRPLKKCPLRSPHHEWLAGACEECAGHAFQSYTMLRVHGSDGSGLVQTGSVVCLLVSILWYVCGCVV